MGVLGGNLRGRSFGDREDAGSEEGGVAVRGRVGACEMLGNGDYGGFISHVEWEDGQA